MVTAAGLEMTKPLLCYNCYVLSTSVEGSWSTAVLLQQAHQALDDIVGG